MKNKLLLIGLGNMGKNHLRVLKILKRKYKFQLKTSDPNVLDSDYGDYKIAIKRFEPDHVLIATPTPTHKEILDYCIFKQIRYIFVEKPIIQPKGNRGLFEPIVPETYLNHRIMVGHIERYNPIVPKIKELIKGKKIDTIICTRSGLKKDEDDYNVDLDLCIHDLDVCQYLLKDNIYGVHELIKNNSANIGLVVRKQFDHFSDKEIGIYLHADNKSPFKRRMIQIIGDNIFIEGDYINQTINYNGENVKVKKREPLRLELERFLDHKFTKKDLKQAINNLEVLR